jgi:predicted Zn-dependent protease
MEEDPVINDYVKGVVDRVYEAMPPQPFRVTTAVIRNQSLNAFAVPGGYVYVFTGLLAQLETEDQLAAVIGHELGHVSQRHVIDRMSKMESVGYLSLLGTLAGFVIGTTGNSNTSEMGQALVVGSQAAGAAAYLTYTQENERQADHVGLQYLVAAGYNPWGMPQTFDIMGKNQFRGRSSKLPGYLRTHPQTAERSAYLSDRIRNMDEDVRSRKDTTEKFLRVRAVIRGRMSDPVWAEATLAAIPEEKRICVDHMALGMAQARLKKTADARASFERALGCGAADPLVLREAGSYYFKEGDFDRARQFLQKALVMNPRDIYALYYNARLLGEQGEYPEAIKYMNKVREQLKTDAEVHYHLGRYLGASGDLFHAHLHLAYAGVYGNDPKQAQFHTKKAEALADTPDKQAELEELRQTRAPKPEE